VIKLLLADNNNNNKGKKEKRNEKRLKNELVSFMLNKPEANS
jgi:hypothetical protein